MLSSNVDFPALMGFSDLLSGSVIVFLAVLGIGALLLMQAAWLAMFVVELFFGTARMTAQDRISTITRYVLCGVVLQVAVITLFIFVLELRGS